MFQLLTTQVTSEEGIWRSPAHNFTRNPKSLIKTLKTLQSDVTHKGVIGKAEVRTTSSTQHTGAQTFWCCQVVFYGLKLTGPLSLSISENFRTP